MTNSFQVSRNWSLFYMFLGVCFLILTGGIVLLLWKGVLLFTNSPSRDAVFQVLKLFSFVAMGIIIYICIYVSLFSLFRGFLERIELNKSGLEYKSFGATILVKWNQVEKIDKQLLGTLWLDGLRVGEVSQIKVWLPKLSSKKYFIPLSLFNISW